MLGADLGDPGIRYSGPLIQRRRRRRIGERAIQAILEMDQITIAAWNGSSSRWWWLSRDGDGF